MMTAASAKGPLATIAAMPSKLRPIAACAGPGRLRGRGRLRRRAARALDPAGRRADAARQDRRDPGERRRRAAAWSPPTRPTTCSPTSPTCPSSVNRERQGGARQRRQQPEAAARRPGEVRGPKRDDHHGDDHRRRRPPRRRRRSDAADDDRAHPDRADHARPRPRRTPTTTTTPGALRRHRAGRTMSPRSPKGELISDRYRIEDRLGSGGMSSVFRATDTILERTVAVKILAEHLSDDERFVARFRREALAVAKLVHPNIVQVYDTGIDGGQPLHRHGVREGQVGRPAAPGGGQARPGDRGRDRRPGLRRPRLRPPPRDHPPRRQAGQPDDHRRPRRAAAT